MSFVFWSCRKSSFLFQVIFSVSLFPSFTSSAFCMIWADVSSVIYIIYKKHVEINTDIPPICTFSPHFNSCTYLHWSQVIVTPRQRQMRRTRCPRHHCAIAWGAQRKTNHARRYCACDGADWNVFKLSTTKAILCQIVGQFERTRIWRRTLYIICQIKGFAFGAH